MVAADREAVLQAWGAASSDLTMLPSGVEVRLDLPSVASLISSGAMPTALRALALQFMGEGVSPGELSNDDREKWEKLERVLVSESVVAIRVPGGDLQPFKITPEDLEADPPIIPRHDKLALRDMVLRIRTPKQVDALSRVAFMDRDLQAAVERDAPEHELVEIRNAIAEKANWAARVVESERMNSIEGWLPFRPDGRGGDAGVDGKDMGPAPVAVADHLGPGGRPRARRGAVDPAAGSPKRKRTAGRKREPDTA